MSGRPAHAAAWAIVLSLLASPAIPLLATAMTDATPTPAPTPADPGPVTAARAAAVLDALDRATGGLPPMLREALAARLAPAMPAAPGPGEDAPGVPGVDGPAVAVSGHVWINTTFYASSSTTYTNATIHLGPKGTIYMNPSGGRALTLTIVDSKVLGTGSLDNRVIGYGGLDVRRSTFTGAVLEAFQDSRHPELTQRVMDSTFRDGPKGLVSVTAEMEAQRNTFSNLTVGAQVRGNMFHNGRQNITLANNTFEMTMAGISITDNAAGLYRDNVLRGNFFGVLCVSSGYKDAAGNLHKPRLAANNAYSNLAEGIAGFRGVTAVTPIGNIAFPSSACDYAQTYLGPAGAAADSVFLSTDDTNADVAGDENPTSAPALPLPLTVINNTASWTGSRALDGPVVVNSPGRLTIANATLTGRAFLGAKANGRITIDNATAGANQVIVLRNDGDLVKQSTIGSATTARPLWIYRCNCTVGGSTVLSGGGVSVYGSEPPMIGVGSGDAALTIWGGMLTDDAAWTPSVTGNVLSGNYGAEVCAAKPTFTSNTFDHDGTGIQSNLCLNTLTVNSNTFVGVGVGIFSFLDAAVTTQSNRFESGNVGFLGALGTMTATQDVFGAMRIGIVPLIEASTTVSLANFTANSVGVYTSLSVVGISSSNLFDNLPLALAAIPLELEGLVIPTGITCTTCYAPPDESWFGNVTVTASPLPNAVPAPSWAGRERIAYPGETITVTGTPDAPVVARSTGTVRVANTTLTLDPRVPFGTKGGGMDGRATGALVLDNATIVHPGRSGATPQWDSLVVNSTSSRITQTRFTGFPQEALQLFWNGGGTIRCASFDGAAAVEFLQGKGGSNLTLDRVLVRSGTGASLGGYWAGQLNIVPPANAVIQRSGLVEGAGPMLARSVPGDAQVHASNLPGTGLAIGDSVNPAVVANAVPINATDNYWGSAYGPYGSRVSPVSGTLAVKTSPYATSPSAPEPCVAFDVVTAQPKDDAAVDFTDRVIDPSGLATTRSWDFGDGTVESTTLGSITHRFPDGGDWNVTLTAISDSGGRASATRTVHVEHTPPKPAFAEDVVDEVTPVAFTDLSTHGNPNDLPPAGWAYDWDFGDGSAHATQREPSHRYADGGTYTVKLRTTDNDGLSAGTQHAITVPHVAPVADFGWDGAAETDTFALHDRSTHPNAPTDGVTTRSWTCSDSFTSTAQDPSHKFADGGSYSCTLTVGDNDGQSDTVTRTIGVDNVAPHAGLRVPGGNELATFRFADASIHPNSPVDAPPAGWRYDWDLNGEARSAERDPSYRFADGGSKRITLTVTDNDGLGDTVTQTLDVAHVPPEARFRFSPAHPDPGQAAEFADLSTHPNAPTDHVVSWHWDLGDGNTSDEASPRHAFERIGQYTVVLTVTDDDGMSASFSLRVPVGNIAPVAAWSRDLESPTDLETVRFTDASYDPDGQVVAWAWDFGDGYGAGAANVTHRFLDDGTYTVRLTVKDNLGALTTLARDIVVRNVAPSGGFAWRPETPFAGDEVQFYDGSSDPDGEPVAWAWDFGDGATSAEKDPVHTYPTGGDYTVALTVWDDDGAPVTTVQQVHVCETHLLAPDGSPDPEVCLRLRVPL